MDVLQYIDVGLVIIDDNFDIQLWNSFMQNHSAKQPDEVLNKNLFEQFPDLPENWFRRKVESVMELHNSAFTTWEQRPYLFKFKSYRPITSIADYMYQNSTIIPLKNITGQVDHICLIIYDVTEVAVNKMQTTQANKRLHYLSRVDGLTGLLNRKTWESSLDEEFRRFSRHQHVTSMLIFDIDHFKKINDLYGHPAGDEVIRRTAAVLKENIRVIDIGGRYGGEEFAVVLIETDVKGAELVAERIRRQMEKNIVVYEQHEIHFTVSLGIAELDATITDKTHWIDCADKALYAAKNNGRNNCAVHQPALNPD